MSAGSEDRQGSKARHPGQTPEQKSSMRPNIMFTSRVLPLVALLLVGATGGCTNMAAPEQPDPDPVEKLGPGIHPVAVITGASNEETRLEVHLKRVGVDIRLASYQAELSHGRGSFVQADLPEGVSGSWNEAAPGQLRFAGAALDGVGNGAVLIAYVRADELKASDLRLKVEELTSTDGFADATALVVAQEHPILLRTALR